MGASQRSRGKTWAPPARRDDDSSEPLRAPLRAPTREQTGKMAFAKHVISPLLEVHRRSRPHPPAEAAKRERRQGRRRRRARGKRWCALLEEAAAASSGWRAGGTKQDNTTHRFEL